MKTRALAGSLLVTAVVLASFALFNTQIVGFFLGGGGDGTDGGTITLTDGMVLDQQVCAARGIEGQVTIFHSPGCPACRATLPVLQEVERETDMRFEYIDVTDDKGRMKELGMMPTLIPTVIIRCKVHVGFQTKEQFESLILGR